MEALPDAADEDPVLGRWPDGDQHPIVECSHGRLKMLLHKKRRPGSGDLYDIEHAKSQHRITLMQKIDRRLLVIMREQDRQVCMVGANVLGKFQRKARFFLASTRRSSQPSPS